MMLQIQNTLVETDIKDSFFISFRDGECVENSSSYRLTYNRILLIKSGGGALQIDDNTFTISGSELFLVAKGQILAFDAGTNFTGYELSFGDCFWEKAPQSAGNCKAVLFNDASANQRLPLSTADLNELSSLFLPLHTEFLKDDYINQIDVMAVYLKIIMIKMANVNASLAQGFDTYENKLYRDFLELISRHYQSSHEVADYAGRLGISTRKLADLSKRCSGKGAKELINRQLIAEAKRSLQFSSKSVKEIAFQLNFSTPDQFSHFFKKNARLSPLDYRTLFVNIGV
ncbi:helix-turn-helix domain-containing protein [Mucilaginibacter sp. X4EP1]|uniref:helix-turn-helix domain-containing protein n=1 Tax=Mucilaginibacter sp. X4EP1 TaxID=2723092 RepID=UPI0021674B67|nr:AraC family transcriptional regulator [Mucilaginibacter sp. X4EP1]MCS3811922.1 AraC-like DNA-binding protein [Mucilaginibacter sp. X4EP1]